MEAISRFLAWVGGLGGFLFVCYSLIITDQGFYQTGWYGWVDRLSFWEGVLLFFISPFAGAFIFGVGVGFVLIMIIMGLLRLFTGGRI